MAADINTQLQNITTDVTAISNLVNRLVTIFSGGGVQNPDLATLKAELQGWTTTQLANYVTLSETQSITGNKYFESGLTIKNTSFDITKDESSNKYWVIKLCDKNNQDIGRLFAYVNANTSLASVAFNIFANNLKDSQFTSTLSAGIVCSPKTGVSYFVVPTYTQNYNDNSNKAVTTAYLQNAECVVHTTGNESISGTKTFTGDVLFEKNGSGVYSYKSTSLDRTSSSTPTTAQYYALDFVDSNGKLINRFDSMVNVNGDTLFEFRVCGYGDQVSENSSQTVFSISSSLNNAEKSINCYEKLNTKHILPIFTSLYDIGSGSSLFRNIYATSGTISTSDKNYKTEISNISEAVMRAWSKVKFKQFKMKDAVAKKGNNARIHMGVIANEDADSIQKAFQSEGLDARNYGLFCYDEWEDQYEDEQILVKPEVRGQVKVVDAQAMYNTVFKEDGTEEQVLVSPEKSHMEEQVIEEAQYRTEKKLVQPAGSRYSVRYEECLALECAYQRWELNKIKVKLGM